MQNGTNYRRLWIFFERRSLVNGTEYSFRTACDVAEFEERSTISKKMLWLIKPGKNLAETSHIKQDNNIQLNKHDLNQSNNSLFLTPQIIVIQRKCLVGLYVDGQTLQKSSAWLGTVAMTTVHMTRSHPIPEEFVMWSLTLVSKQFDYSQSWLLTLLLTESLTLLSCSMEQLP